MNHETFASRLENIAMATGIIAGLSAAAATIATPTGLSAFGVWLGLMDEPLIVTAAPILDNLATVSGTISGMSYFYVMRKKRKTQKQSEPDNSEQPD